MHRSQQPSTNPPKPTSNRESGRSLKGIDYFVLLNRLVDEYTKPFQSHAELNASAQNCFYKKDQRLARIQKIHSFIEQIELYCNLAQEEKNDCLGESLQIVKKIRLSPNRNEIQTRSKRLSLTAELKAIYQVEMAVIQNMSELILLKMVPTNRTSHTICQFIRTLIEQLCGCQPQPGITGTDKQKTKKPNRKNQKDRVMIECCLQSGGKVELVWYLTFRVVQKNLQEILELFNAEKQKDGDTQLGAIYEKYVFKHIKEVINRLILDQFVDTNLTKQLLKAIVQNISEIELPIVPFFLKCLHQILQENFKIYYTISFDRDHCQKIASKELYSLQNIQSLLEIIDKSANNIAEYESSKIQTKFNGVCSYCGVSKINSWDRLIYQRIAIKINERHNLVINICEQCCMNLNAEPSEQMSIVVFAPLIMSRFWKEQMSSKHLIKVRQGLKGLLMYHGFNQAKNVPKSKRNKSEFINITQKVAMNNQQQAVPAHLLTQIYNSFLFRHVKLSTKQILINLLQITTIFWNSKDQKVREKSIKMLNKPYITSFLFDSSNLPQRAQVLELSHKIVKCLQARLRDSSELVSLASLEFLADLFVRGNICIGERQQFYDSICKSIQQQRNAQYRFQMYEVMQKMVNKLRSRQGDIQNELILLRCYLRTYLLVINSLLFQNGQDSTEGPNLGDVLSRLIQAVFTYISSLTELQPTGLKQALWRQCQLFFVENGYPMLHLKSLEQVSEQLMINLLIRIKLAPDLLKSLTFLRVQTVRSLLGMLESPSCPPECESTIQHNICLLIEIVFQDVLNLNQQICTRKRRQSSSLRSSKLNIQQIGDYINSSSFIELLVNCISEANKNIDPKEVELPRRSKLYILDKLLKCNSVNNILSRRREVVKYMNIWSKNHRKSASKSIDPIILSSNLELRLQIVAQALLQALKSSDLDVLELHASLVVNIKVMLGSVEDLKQRVLVTYQKYSQLFLQKYLSLNSQMKNNCKTTLQDIYIMTYLSLCRCLHISTVLIVKLQVFLVQNLKMEQFYEKQIASLADGKRQSKFSSYQQDQNQEIITTSERFKKFYTLIISVLAYPDEFIKQESQMVQSYKKMLMLLKYYWQVHPKSIFIDSRLTSILKDVDAKTQDGFSIVKSMFKLFESVLPCHNIELLSFIRQQFAKRFHSLIRETQDKEFIQSSFSIIYQLLKSGMEGIYQYNKYVFYGILSPFSQVNQLTLKLVKEIYFGQTSEKALFINLMESVEFCLESLFGNNLYGAELTEAQRDRLQLLSELTRSRSSCLLQKDKREMKMKSTFVKRVGDLLVSQMAMIKSKPTLLLLFLKMVKSLRVLDYIQVSEIAFSLNKLMLHHQLFIEEQIKSLKGNDIKTEPKENVQIKISQIVAYRQIVSCLAYFCQYQEVTHQIKTYETAFQQSKNPYLELQESVPLTRIDQTDSLRNQLQLVEKEIDIFINIIIGDVQCVTRTPNNWQYQDQNSGSSNQTVLTKGKGSKKGKANDPKHNKHTKHSVSLDKFNSEATSLEASSSEVDSYKSRLRRQDKKNYKKVCAEC